jgi:hypothetical protein
LVIILVSRIALRLLKIIEPYLVEQERTWHGECTTFEVWVEAFGAELLFYFIVLDGFFPEEPSLPRTGYFKTVATIQLVLCFPISAVFYQQRLSNGSS